MSVDSYQLLAFEGGFVSLFCWPLAHARGSVTCVESVAQEHDADSAKRTEIPESDTWGTTIMVALRPYFAAIRIPSVERQKGEPKFARHTQVRHA
jgi:hypothetical protein